MPKNELKEQNTKSKQESQKTLPAMKTKKGRGRRPTAANESEPVAKSLKQVAEQTAKKEPKHGSTRIGSPEAKGGKKEKSKKESAEKEREAVKAVEAAAKETKKTRTKQSEKTAEQKKAVSPKKAVASRAPREKADPTSVPKTAPAVPYDENARLRIIPLGGLNEIGKNMTAIECGRDIIVIDCGIAFPDEEMPGIDLVIPDFTYLEENAMRVRGILLTHGHEDHIGAIPYVLRNINPPIYGTKLTLGIVRNKLKEFSLEKEPRLITVSAGDTVSLGNMTAEFIHVNHSIADACALAIKTPVGTVVHSGDFKLDLTPIDGEIMDITRLGELGKEGVLLLLCESTNAERPGSTPSERKVGASMEYIFNIHKEKRIIIATFSSNVHRVQQLIDAAVRHNRKVAVTGRSMLNIVGAAVELGYMHVPEGVLIDISEIKKYKPEQLTIVTTGSQGEPMSALYRMAFGDHREVTLGRDDVVVISSSAIPGNEKLVGRIINELCKSGVETIHDASLAVHVSGHACQEEIKLMMALTKPKYVMPVHGEYKHLAANRELAMSMGIPSQNIFISEIGNVLEIDKRGPHFGGTVPSGRVFVDGYGVGDVGNIVLRDRLLLSQDGLIVVAATVSADGGYILSGPEIISRGFVYVRESEDLMEEMRTIAEEVITNGIVGKSRADWYQIKNKVKDDLAKFIYTKTKRKPMILPMIMNI